MTSELSGPDEDARAAGLVAAQEKAVALFAEVETRELVTPGVAEREVSDRIRDLANEMSVRRRTRTLQVHRLAYRDRTLVNNVLRARYGRFTPRLRFEKLHRLLTRRGVPLHEIPEPSPNGPYFRTFWQPDSQVALSVIGTYGEYSTPENLRVGDVYSVQASMAAEEVEWRKVRVAG
ncbi:hypothetical protein [Streptomyces cyaneofuscatus]